MIGLIPKSEANDQIVQQKTAHSSKGVLSDETKSSQVEADSDKMEDKEADCDDVDGGVALSHVTTVIQETAVISSVEDCTLAESTRMEDSGAPQNTSALSSHLPPHATSLVQETRMVTSSGFIVEDDSNVLAGNIEKETITQRTESFLPELSATTVPHKHPAVMATSSRITCDESWVAVGTLEIEEDSLSWAESSEGSPESEESSSLHLSQSSPHLSQGMTSMLGRSQSGRNTGPARHGTYGKVEVEINPFASEFKKGVRPEDSVSKLPQFTSVNTFSSSRPSSASRKLNMSYNMFSPMSCTSPLDSGRTAIPMKAFNDPGFLAFMEEMGKEPEVSDYVLYKMRVIGDEIEKRYSEELNQAMDEVFFEVVKHSLSWHTFKSVSRKLLVYGTRIQDSILLVPCFARRLVDVMPQMGGRIVDYTEEVLDSYASDSILGMGGWVSDRRVWLVDPEITCVEIMSELRLVA